MVVFSVGVLACASGCGGSAQMSIAQPLAEASSLMCEMPTNPFDGTAFAPSNPFVPTPTPPLSPYPELEPEPVVATVESREPPARPGAQPRRLSRMWNTYYVVSDESAFRGEQRTQLFDVDCRPIARVRRRFYNDLCIQGSGVLEDGRVVNYGRRCTRFCPAAPTCGNRNVRVCYVELDSERFPHGLGAGVPLRPARTIAVDPRRVALGSWLYLEELDGVRVPGTGEIHDGCVRAEDTGGGIREDHFDIFAGSRADWRSWERILPTRTRFTPWIGHPRCADRGGPTTRLPPFDQASYGPAEAG